MTRQAIIQKTVNAINYLPESKAEEISDFADFVIKKYEEQMLNNGIKKILSQGNTFDFLENEEDIYSIADLKETYNG